jgi:hypothetical protein
MGSDALILQTDRTTGAFDTGSPGAQIPSTASGNYWTGFQTVTGSVADGLVTINDTYAGNTVPIEIEGAGGIGTTIAIRFGDATSAPYDNGLLYHTFSAFSNVSETTCIADDATYLGPGPSLCVDGTGAILNSASRKGTFICTSGGTIAITNANYLVTSDVIITMNTLGGTPTAAPFYISVTGSTGFSVKCSAGDTSTYNYNILN